LNIEYTKAKRGSGDTIGVQDTGLAPLYAYVVADYHTHGADTAGYDNENFSDYDDPTLSDDKDTNRNGAPPHVWPMGYGRIAGYLGTPSGKIKRYNPWSEQVQILGEGAK
jgi:hypothetical protein